MLHFHYAGLTNTGMLRDHNEDAYKLPVETDANDLASKGHLYVLADGMGGHQKGEVASAVTIEVVHSQYYDGPAISTSEDTEEAIVDALADAIEEANLQVMEATEGGGTTIVASVLYENLLVTMNVGDSRAYLLRDNTLRLISKDHSLVSRLVELGKITEEEALTHPRRNVLYQALGQGAGVETYISNEIVQNGDIIILCSDGLWGEIEDPDIMTVLKESESPYHAAQTLIDMANASGGPDNITAIIVKVSDQAPPDIEYPFASQYPTNIPADPDATQPSVVIHEKPNTLPEGRYFVDDE